MEQIFGVACPSHILEIKKGKKMLKSEFLELIIIISSI